MNEELEQLVNQVKQLAPWFLAAAIAFYGWKLAGRYLENRRAAASESVASAYTTDELEEAVAKFGSSRSGGVLKLRLAKSYFDSANHQGALEIYESLAGRAPEGFEDVPVVGRAQCLEALGRFDEALEAYDAFAEASPGSFLALTARLGAARSIARAGEGGREKALARLAAIKLEVGDDELKKARVEATEDVVKRWEPRVERSLFDAADAAQKELDAKVSAEEKPAEEPAAGKPAEEKPAAEKPAEAKPDAQG